MQAKFIGTYSQPHDKGLTALSMTCSEQILVRPKVTIKHKITKDQSFALCYHIGIMIGSVCVCVGGGTKYALNCAEFSDHYYTLVPFFERA